MPDSKKLPTRLTHKGGRAVRKALAKTRSGVEKVPGPSPKPATNVLIAEILVRSAGRLARRTMEKGLLKARFEKYLSQPPESDEAENDGQSDRTERTGMTAVTESEDGSNVVTVDFGRKK